jgi:DNA-directed RNA polymerase specialized sigma24 family protein
MLTAQSRNIHYTLLTFKTVANASDFPISQIPRQMRTNFDESFCMTIKLDSVAKRINWLRSKYQVQDEIEIGDVICEAYSRGIKSLEAGREISNVGGWFRSTSHNIIREKFRAKGRRAELNNRLLHEHNSILLEANVISCTSEHTQVDELWNRLARLKVLDCKILILQAQGRSMRQIATQLIENGDYQDCPNIVGNITQRASRARRQLREG